MFRGLTSLALIVALLVCPFRCMGKAAQAGSSADCVRCCCEHCRDSQIPDESPSTGDRELPPAERPGDCDCICAGAMLIGQILRCPALHDANPLSAAVAVFDRCATGSHGIVADAAGPPPDAAAAGRTLHLAINSLQV